MRQLSFLSTGTAFLLLSVPPVFSQSQQDLIKGSANTDNVVNYGMNYGQHRFSLNFA